MTITSTRFLRLVVSVLLSAGTGAAMAQVPPASIAGTIWNLTIAGQPASPLTIDTQAGPGAPGNQDCRNLHGVLGDQVPVEGFYCVANGHLQLLHKNIGSRNTVRVFSGEVFIGPTGQSLMRGVVGNHASAFGDLGYFGFVAEAQ
jgi:hypothetical protein